MLKITRFIKIILIYNSNKILIMLYYKYILILKNVRALKFDVNALSTLSVLNRAKLNRVVYSKNKLKLY